MRKSKAPVVITRKDKRLHKLAHLIGFAATGGASGIYTAGKAATNASYNARTRKLAAQAEAADMPPAAHSAMLADAAEQAARKAVEHGIPRDQLGLAAQLAYDRLKRTTGE